MQSRLCLGRSTKASARLEALRRVMARLSCIQGFASPFVLVLESLLEGKFRGRGTSTSTKNRAEHIALLCGFDRFVAERRQAAGFAESRVAITEFCAATALFAEFAMFGVTVAVLGALARGLAGAAFFGAIDGAGAAGSMKNTAITASNIDVEEQRQGED